MDFENSNWFGLCMTMGNFLANFGLVWFGLVKNGFANKNWYKQRFSKIPTDLDSVWHLHGFGCSRPVLDVLGWFWVFLAGFECYWLVKTHLKPLRNNLKLLRILKTPNNTQSHNLVRPTSLKNLRTLSICHKCWEDFKNIYHLGFSEI